MQFQLQARQTSQPIPVLANTVVAVTPSASATALVEYSADGLTGWTAWTKGTTQTATRDYVTTASYVRVTADGSGGVTVDIHESSSEGRIATYTSAWVNGVEKVTGIGTPEGGNLLLTQAAVLSKWRKALAQMRDGTKNPRLLIVGDSTTVGSGSGGANYTGANGKAKNWVAKFTDLVNKYRAPASCHALVGAGNAAPYTTFDTRVVAGAGWAPSSIGAALGGTVFSNSTTNNALTFTPAGPVDTFVVWYAKNTTLASVDASIDGGAVTQLVGAGTKSVTSTTLTAGSVGTHTLSLARSTGTSGNFYPLAIQAYDSTQKQIEVWNCGWSGSKVTDQAVGANPWDVLSAIPTYAPDLTQIMLTINDANAATPLATYKSSLQQIIDAAKQTGDVVLMSGVPSSSATTALATQQLYIDAVRSLADSNKLLFIDNWREFGSYEAMNALGFYTDTLHPSSMGYSDLATVIYNPMSRLI